LALTAKDALAESFLPDRDPAEGWIFGCSIDLPDIDKARTPDMDPVPERFLFEGVRPLPDIDPPPIDPPPIDEPRLKLEPRMIYPSDPYCIRILYVKVHLHLTSQGQGLLGHIGALLQS
jgi:hypothetical protein